MLRIAVVMTPPAPYRIPLLNRLAALPGIQLTVLSTDPYGSSRQNAPAPYQFQYEIFPTRLWFTQNQFGDRMGVVLSPALTGHLRHMKYDAIVALGWTMPNTVLTRTLGAMGRTPVILWDESIPHAHSAVKGLLLPMLRRYFGSFDGYLAASSGCREYMISMGAAPERVVLFPQVADNHFFQSENARLHPQREALKHARGIETKRVILFVGQLIPRKGVWELMEAFEWVSARDADVSLVMVGDGVLRPDLEARRAASPQVDRIFIASFTSQQELPTYYALADVFVLPSLYDTFGVVVNEAMASGLPIVTTHNVGAVADLVADGVNGRVVAPGDANALAQALLALVQDNALRDAMGIKSSERIGQWTIEMAADAFVECVTRSAGARVNRKTVP